VCVQSPKARGDSRKHKSCRKHKSLSLYDVVFATNTGRCLLHVPLLIDLKINLCATLTTQNTTEKTDLACTEHNCTSTKSVFFKLKYVAYCSRETDFPFTNDCQGHMQTPQSLSVVRADNLITFMCRLSWHLGASTSWNPQGLCRPVMGFLYRYLPKKLTVPQLVKISNTFDGNLKFVFTPPPATRASLSHTNSLHVIPQNPF